MLLAFLALLGVTKAGKPIAGNLEQLELIKVLGENVYWNNYFPREAKRMLLVQKIRQAPQFNNDREYFNQYTLNYARNLKVEVVSSAVHDLL